MELQGQLSPHARSVSERRFWIALSCAALLHACMIVGVGRSAPRQLGERDGNPDAISVELVDPVALRGGASAEPGQGDAASPSPPASARDNPVAANHRGGEWHLFFHVYQGRRISVLLLDSPCYARLDYS